MGSSKQAWSSSSSAGLPRTFSTTPTLTLRTSEGDFDLLDRVAGLDGYDTTQELADEVVAMDLAFRVLGLRALIRAKEATGRAKDLAQLPMLRALLALRERE